jgi:anti-sigma B factor antagonist
MDLTWRLEIDRAFDGEVLVLTLAGRVGSDASGRLIEAVVDAVAAGHLLILLDLRQIDYLSSAGLLALDAAAGRVYAAGGRLVVCEAKAEPVRFVLEMADLLVDVPLEPSRQAGLARLRESRR